jgi:hypothetical protein
MYVMLVFDTEDVYYAPEYRIDDIPGWLSEIMTETGITGTFFVMGEKARSMLDRGRADVLEKMAEHDIGSHQQGNRHPLVPEVLQGKGWQEGVEAMRRYEDWVREAHVDAFGREPKSRPAIATEVDLVTNDQLLLLCRQVVDCVESDGCLPANVQVSGSRVGISQFVLLAARSYLALARYEKLERLRVVSILRYPQTAFELDAWVRRNIGEHWAMPLDFTCEYLAEHARLQTWSMKPAWMHPPQGSVADGERYGSRLYQGSEGEAQLWVQ